MIFRASNQVKAGIPAACSTCAISNKHLGRTAGALKPSCNKQEVMSGILTCTLFLAWRLLSSNEELFSEWTVGGSGDTSRGLLGMPFLSPNNFGRVRMTEQKNAFAQGRLTVRIHPFSKECPILTYNLSWSPDVSIAAGRGSQRGQMGKASKYIAHRSLHIRCSKATGLLITW